MIMDVVNATPIRLLVADDHRLVRQSLLGMLAADSSFEVVADASTGSDALTLIRSHQPDIAVLDISMPAPTGVEVAELLRAERSHTRVLILTMHTEPAMVRRALRAGACGVVLKDDAIEDLCYGIRTVHGGRTYISPSLTAATLNSTHEQELSARETQALRLVVEGLTSKEIASQMGVTTKTVDTYRARASQKLGARNGAELVRLAIRQGLVRAL